MIGVVFIVSGIIIGGADLWLLVPGAIFLIAAILDVCVLAPFIGRPVRGKKFRSDEGCA